MTLLKNITTNLAVLETYHCDHVMAFKRVCDVKCILHGDLIYQVCI